MSERRDQQRRQADRRASGRALVPASPAVAEPRSSAAAPTPPDPQFQAQLIGQDGQKRGLRGGKEVLDQARSTYLGSEYSGAADRRPRPGRTTKTEI